MREFAELVSGFVDRHMNEVKQCTYLSKYTVLWLPRFKNAGDEPMTFERSPDYYVFHILRTR